MSKIFGILTIVLGIWVAMEVFNKGADHAFGGVFASGEATEEKDGEPRSVSRRTGESVDQAHAEAARRRERLLDE